MMQIFHGFKSLPSFVHPVVTVGSFDGVHRGHQVLLDSVKSEVQRVGGESVVLTFEPHPRITLGREVGLQLLTTLDEKAALLEQMGIDNLIVIPFDAAFSRVSPHDFVQNYLIEKIMAETLVVGYNHHFGYDNEGNYDYFGHRGFPLRVIKVGECNFDAAKVSSTVIRKLIANGEVVRAGQLLGHPYLIMGKLAGGGVETPPLKLIPAPGNYSVQINGTQAEATVNSCGRLNISGFPDGEVVLEII